MKKTFTIICMLCIAIITFAQEEKPAANKPVSPEISAIKTAAGLAKYGYTNYSATALLESAKILANTPVAELKAEVSHGSSDVAAEKAQTVSFDPVTMVSDAKKFAGKDKTVAALAKDVEKDIKASEKRGAVSGPYLRTERVKAKTTDEYRIRFRGGELAEVGVIGDGDTDLDLFIYDENGNLIASDTSYGDDCLCQWVPSWTGIFVIRVKNCGSVYNNYIFMTN